MVECHSTLKIKNIIILPFLCTVARCFVKPRTELYCTFKLHLYVRIQNEAIEKLFHPPISKSGHTMHNKPIFLGKCEEIDVFCNALGLGMFDRHGTCMFYLEHDS